MSVGTIDITNHELLSKARAITLGFEESLNSNFDTIDMKIQDLDMKQILTTRGTSVTRSEPALART